MLRDADGLEVEGMLREELLDDKYYVTIDLASPGIIAYENGIAYDYFFLYIESLSGEQSLQRLTLCGIIRKSGVANVISNGKYLRDPCRAASIPY